MGIAFEITINDEKKVVAGIDGISVLSFILSYKKKSEEKNDEIDSTDLSVGGLIHHGKNDYEHLDWIKRHLKIGDKITICIVETCDLTKPISREREDPKFVEKAQRKYYETLKKEYDQT